MDSGTEQAWNITRRAGTLQQDFLRFHEDCSMDESLRLETSFSLVL